MKHKKYERYLHLNRAGELQPAERAELAEHLKSCAACAERAKEMKGLEQTLGTMRAFSSELPASSAVTERIMDAVRTPESGRSIGYILDRFLARFFIPRIPRIAYSTVCVCLIGLFSVQSLDTLIRIRGFEQRLASSDQSSGTTGGQIIIRHAELPAVLAEVDKELLEQGSRWGIRFENSQVGLPRKLAQRWRSRLSKGNWNFGLLRFSGAAQNRLDRGRVQSLIENLRTITQDRALGPRFGR